MRRIFIYAPSVKSGGGITLLAAIYEAFLDSNHFLFYVNEHTTGIINSESKTKVKFFKSNIFSRLSAELYLLFSAKRDDLIICFGNIPPFFWPKGQVFIFIQNRFVVDRSLINIFTIRKRIAIITQGLLFKYFIRNKYHLIVQTSSMFQLLEKYVKGVKLENLHILPLAPAEFSFKKIDRSKPQTIYLKRFIYVASGEPHKNHLRLFKAWEILANDGLYPSLYLTLNEKNNAEIIEIINASKIKNSLEIFNLGILDSGEIKEAYKSMDALIFPSLVESFGLPLIESSNANLPILASELDFVRDIVSPVETFDPYSASSIARAVKRFMGVKDFHERLLDPVMFIEKINSISKI
jgi:glycosyltransferase involved in cell wall biosynthesis